jgi:hypothetical protein
MEFFRAAHRSTEQQEKSTRDVPVAQYLFCKECPAGWRSNESHHTGTTGDFYNIFFTHFCLLSSLLMEFISFPILLICLIFYRSKSKLKNVTDLSYRIIALLECIVANNPYLSPLYGHLRQLSKRNRTWPSPARSPP